MTSHPLTETPATSLKGGSSDRGDTLIEILISLLILSGTVVALLTAFSTSISASSQYRGLVVSDTVLRAVSEQVNGVFQEGTTFKSCAVPSDYNSNPLIQQALVAPTPYNTVGDYTASVTNVQYWGGTSFGTTCVAPDAPQILTIQLAGPLTASKSIDIEVEGSGQIANGIKLAPPTNVTPSTPTTSGESGTLTVTFNNSSNAPANWYYTVRACTDSAMQTGCPTLNAANANEFQSGDELQGLVPGTVYYVTVFANAAPGYQASDSAEGGPAKSSGVLYLPAITSVAPSTSTSGALVVNFTPPADAPAGDTFTAHACLDSAMTTGCVTPQSPFNSGDQFTGLTPGVSYYVEIEANADAASTPPYAGTTSLPFSPSVMATVQLTAPTNVSASSSTVHAGAIVVNFSNSGNAPSSGQTYTVRGCMDSAMSTGCSNNQSGFISGSELTGLTPGESYYVSVYASASTGYLASTATTAPSPPSPTFATVMLGQPVITGISSGTQSGQIIVQIQPPSVSASSQTYTLVGCKNANMTSGCLTYPLYTPNTSVGAWPSGKKVYVTVMANASTGYLASVPSAQVQGVAT